MQHLGIKHPIIQAPMAGVSTPRLAAAVSNSGALGSLGIGASTVDQARAMIDETRSLTRKPININVFCHAPPRRDRSREEAWLKHLQPLFAEAGTAVPDTLDEIFKTFLQNEEILELLIDKRPAVVSFHFGLPSQGVIDALRDAGVVTLASATNLREAHLIEHAKIDAIVAQGSEAGGHRGMFDPEAIDERLSTSVLVQLLVERTKLPVIAAGGIMNGRAVKAMLDLGAAAAQLGTTFILCPESSADAGYRSSLKSESAAITRLTSVFSGRPARGIVNRLVTFGEGSGSPVPAAYPLSYDASRRLNLVAGKQGNNQFAAHWAGQGAPLAREMPAADLIAMLVREMEV